MSSDKRDLTRVHHHTKIIATLGPATEDIETIEHMIRVGLNVIRLNFSHGNRDIHEENMRRVRLASERAGREVAVIADLQGPKIRVGKIQNGQVTLARGQTLILDANLSTAGDSNIIGLDYQDLPKDVVPNDVLLLDDGLIKLTVLKIDGEQIHARVENEAILKSNKGINKLGGGLSAPALTDKDHQDLKTAVAIGADYLAVSFVKSGTDMEFARQLVGQASSSSHRPGLIAKIERVEAIENLEDIIRASDGVMVARGDLAVEVGNPAVPALQKKIIRQARKMRRFTITATQMMESMIQNPVPTRAEVSDVANAVLDGSDAVMLSAETAVGDYPFETVLTMAQICAAAENTQEPLKVERNGIETSNRIDHSIASGAVFTAQQLNAKAIVALTESGTTAFQISRFGINIPIYALTTNQSVQRKMTLYRGVRPLMLDTSKDHVTAIREAEEHLAWRGIVNSGDIYVITSGVNMGQAGATNTLQICRAQ